MTSDEASSVATPIEKVERTVDVRGIATHMFEAGPPTATSLLYLHDHGLGNLWLELHQRLAQSFHFFAPSIPGFGVIRWRGWMREMRVYSLSLPDSAVQLSLY